MAECILAWMSLIGWICTENPLYLIASGTFAIATQISRFKE